MKHTRYLVIGIAWLLSALVCPSACFATTVCQLVLPAAFDSYMAQIRAKYLGGVTCDSKMDPNIVVRSSSEPIGDVWAIHIAEAKDMRSEDVVVHELLHGWLRATKPHGLKSSALTKAACQVGDGEAKALYTEFSNYFDHRFIVVEEKRFGLSTKSRAASLLPPPDSTPPNSSDPNYIFRIVEEIVLLLDIELLDSKAALKYKRWLRKSPTGPGIIQLANQLKAQWAKDDPQTLDSIAKAYLHGVEIVKPFLPRTALGSINHACPAS